VLKTSRIALALLGCSLAAFPLAATNYGLPPCDSGSVLYSAGSIHPGPNQTFAQIADQADRYCRQLWPSATDYQTNRCYVSVTGPYQVNNHNVYEYGCWRCSSSIWGCLNEQTLDLQQAIVKALIEWPEGRAISVDIGQRETSEGTRPTYHVNLRKEDFIFGVDVDAETGEVLTTPENFHLESADDSQP